MKKKSNADINPPKQKPPTLPINAEEARAQDLENGYTATEVQPQAEQLARDPEANPDEKKD